MERGVKNLLACPFCGGTNITFSCSTHHGHGDCGYEDARFVCQDCVATKGLYNYGSPSNDTEKEAARAWNTRGGELAQEPSFPEEKKEVREQDKIMADIIEAYSDYNFKQLMDFLTIKGKKHE